MACERCKRKRKTNRHHITYKPDRIAVICEPCHEKITLINTYAGRLLRQPLSPVTRMLLYVWFCYTKFGKGTSGVTKKLKELAKILKIDFDSLGEGHRNWVLSATCRLKRS